jgi:WD40 repeat protein/DNA-binding winged helix-turn-helix (wHTH) protein
MYLAETDYRNKKNVIISAKLLEISSGLPFLMEVRPHLIYEFGRFRLDMAQRVLAKDGAMVALAPKVLDTLVFLVQNRGRVLGKKELVEALWPESFVEESNLSQNIFLLRKLLGDGIGDSAFIQTIPRRGYRFVAEVKEAEATTSTLSVRDADYWNQHSPFRSLQAFEPEDAWLFFGRETETQDLLGRLQDFPVLGIVGNSGCGKSSLVRAGLIPALEAGLFCHQGGPIESWRVAVFRPSAAPFDYLAEILPKQIAPDLSLKLQTEFIADCRSKFPLGGDSLRNAVSALASVTDDQPGQTHVLLVVDQFEELFTLTSDPKVRDRYIDALLAAARLDSAVPVHVVLILRADFYAHCLDHPELSRRLETNIYNVPRMTHYQLRQSIEKRLELAAAPAESGLINALLEDVGSEPGNLALLEHALGQLWEKCGGSGRTLTNRAYAEIGRLRGALGRHADSVYESMRDETQKHLVRRIFLELVHLGEGAQDTRRRVPKSDLNSLGSPENVEPLLARLISSRLISTGMEGDEMFVEVSHEALIREWPALREWLMENREELRLERRLHQAAEEWEILAGDKGALLQGARLSQGEEWLARHPNAPPLVRRFLEVSVEICAEDQERELIRQKELRSQAEARARVEKELGEQQASSAARARQSASRLRWLSGALALLMSLAIAAAGVAYHQQLIERSHAYSARSAELLSRDHGQALQLAMLSWRTSRNQEARLAIARAFPQLLATLKHDGPVMQVSYSADGRRILSAGEDHTARLWDAADGRLLATLQGHTDAIGDAAFSPDGRQIVTASHDRTARLWTADGRLLAVLGESGGTAGPYNISVSPRAVFSPDGKRVVTAGWDQFARLWNTADGRLLAVLKGHTENVQDAEFSPDGKHIVTASFDHTARVWNSADGHLESTLAGHTEWVEHAEFFPDGERILTTSWDRTARIWRRSDGRLLSILHHDGPVNNARFSPDGRRMVTVSRDNTARVWDASDGGLLFTLRHDGTVHRAEFSRDGQYIVTSSNDHTARVWSNVDGQLLATLEGHAEAVNAVAFSPDSRRIVTASGDNTVRLWSMVSSLLSATLRGHTDYLRYAEFSRDGQRILTVSHDHTARIWNTADGSLRATLQGGPVEFRQGSFSPEGDRVVTSSAQGAAQVWSSFDGRLLATLQGQAGGLWQAQFSPNGRRVVTAGEDGTARIWDAADGRMLINLQGHAKTVWYAAFSPDGQRVVTTSDDHTARIWNSDNGHLLFVLQGHSDSIWRAAFSPDGRRIVTAGFDHTARVWDSADGHLVAVLQGHTDKIINATFSADSSKIVTASWDHTARVWNSADGGPLATLQGHTGRLINAEFSPDGQYIATSGYDHVSRVWRTDNFELVTALEGHAEAVWQTRFSPDGRFIVTASVDQTARIWRLLSLDDLRAILAE